MKANHNLEVNITPKELAKMLADAPASDFTCFWMEWERITKNKKLDEIAKSWNGWNNGHEAFKKFLAMIDYHGISKDD